MTTQTQAPSTRISHKLCAHNRSKPYAVKDLPGSKRGEKNNTLLKPLLSLTLAGQGF